VEDFVMKKMSILVAGLLLLSLSQTAQGASSAVATQETTVNVVTPAPQVNNTSSSNTEVGVGITNSPSNSVGINNSPTNNNQGGSAKSAINDSGNSVLILDQSQTGNETYNRQHIGAPGVASAPAAQMFDPWEQSSWNISPITAGSLDKGVQKEKIDFLKLQERIYAKFDPTTKINLRGNLFDPSVKKPFYVAPSGIKIGTLSMVMPEDKTVEDALLYAASVGMANGADQIEIIQYGGRKKPTVKGTSIGFGSGASGLMGNTEAIAVAAGGGTNFSTSSIVKEEEPWLTVTLWKNGSAPKQTIRVAPVKEEPSVNKLDKKKTIQ
jgi:hypothetical protein